MPTTRAEAEAAFNYAWSLARGARTSGGGLYRDDPRALEAAVYEHFDHLPNFLNNDARRAASQAIRAVDAARMLDMNRADRNAAVNRDYGLNTGIDRRRGDYEYRVIVQGTGAGASFETLVFVRSRTRLSGQEIIEQAERSFIRNAGLARSYRARIDALGAAPTLNSFIMSASRNPG